MKQFEYVEAKKPQSSGQDLSHERKTTLNFGELTPVLCAEVIPGDVFKIDFEAFLRTMPLLSPVMHRVNLFAHAFYVPDRLLLGTDRFQKFITGEVDDTLPSIDETFSQTYAPVLGDLLDHLNYGVRPSVSGPNAVMSQMAIRAYHKIWNDWYRDQNFQPEYDIIGLPDNIDFTFPAPSMTEFFSCRKRAWEKDYFTSALPTPQRGGAVTLPLGGVAPVRNKVIAGVEQPLRMHTVPAAGAPAVGGVGTNAGSELVDSANTTINVNDGLEADLTAATGTTISALRHAFALQRFLEVSMRFGRRFKEFLLGVFNVVSSDARLQRAEFICGGKLPVQIGEVLQTSQTSTTPQGNMAGRGVSAGHLFHMKHRFEEHGWFMVIVSVVPRTSYTNLCMRQNLKLDQFDFAIPQFAHLSEQPVRTVELFNVPPTPADANEVFGYQPIYEEYRYIPDSVHGQFRDSLGYWSMARDADLSNWANRPRLNESFIKCVPRTDIFPVEDGGNQLLLQSACKFFAYRPIPKHGTPL